MARGYKKGLELIHLETAEKIVFGKWNEDGTAGCITKKHTFVNVSKEDLTNNYTTRAEQDRKYREQRRTQGW